MGEEAITSGRQKALRGATILLDPAITRSRCSSLLDGRTKELVRGCRKAAKQLLEGLPPVSLLKVGDAYFVRDGNHRVSVARWFGVEALDAEVADLHAADPLQAPIFTLCLPERCRHLNPSESPPYRCKRWPRERRH